MCFIHSSFLKSLEKNLLSRNETLRLKAVTTLKVLLLILAGLYLRIQIIFTRRLERASSEQNEETFHATT